MKTQVYILMLFALGSVLAYPQSTASLDTDDGIPVLHKRGVRSWATNNVDAFFKHKLKQIPNGRDAGKFVVNQNLFGRQLYSRSCSLIAIFNILILRGDIEIDPVHTPTISDDFMVDALQRYLDDEALMRPSSWDDTLSKVREFLPSLKGGLRVVTDASNSTIFTDYHPEVNLLKGLCRFILLFSLEAFDIPFMHFDVMNPTLLYDDTFVSQPTSYGLDQATLMMKKEKYSILLSELHVVSY
jgi:hypothetical protein